MYLFLYGLYLPLEFVNLVISPGAFPFDGGIIGVYLQEGSSLDGAFAGGFILEGWLLYCVLEAWGGLTNHNFVLVEVDIYGAGFLGWRISC